MHLTLLIACRPALDPSPASVEPAPAGPDDVVIAAVGDISPNELGAQVATSDAVLRGDYAAVLLLGDAQYPAGSLEDFQTYFDPTWGRLKPALRPAPGNHEYRTENAAGYYAYFGEAAGDPTRGYYSFDLGAWHVIALNTNDKQCGIVPCDAASEQVAWLKADLAAHPSACTLAIWHHPRFNSGAHHGDAVHTQALWDALYAAGAEIVLNGHEHVYERFDPQTPSGQADPARGLQQFTVGTGGAAHYEFADPKPNSAAREAESFGHLELTLRPTSYDWRFIAVAPSTFADAGHGECH